MMLKALAIITVLIVGFISLWLILLMVGLFMDDKEDS